MCLLASLMELDGISLVEHPFSHTTVNSEKKHLFFFSSDAICFCVLIVHSSLFCVSIKEHRTRRQNVSLMKHCTASLHPCSASMFCILTVYTLLLALFSQNTPVQAPDITTLFFLARHRSGGTVEPLFLVDVWFFVWRKNSSKLGTGLELVLGLAFDKLNSNVSPENMTQHLDHGADSSMQWFWQKATPPAGGSLTTPGWAPHQCGSRRRRAVWQCWDAGSAAGCPLPARSLPVSPPASWPSSGASW